MLNTIIFFSQHPLQATNAVCHRHTSDPAAGGIHPQPLRQRCGEGPEGCCKEYLRHKEGQALRISVFFCVLIHGSGVINKKYIFHLGSMNYLMCAFFKITDQFYQFIYNPHTFIYVWYVYKCPLYALNLWRYDAQKETLYTASALDPFPFLSAAEQNDVFSKLQMEVVSMKVF